MSDEALTAAVTAAVLGLPEVERIYPPRRTLRSTVHAATAFVRDLRGAPALEADGGVSVDVGLRAGAAATTAGLACVEAVRRVLPPDREGAPVTLRIVAVD